MRRLARLLHAIGRDCGGTTMVEFAVAFPILLTMYMGSFALSDALACNRKVTVATRALTDLTTRYSIITPNDLNMIMAASQQVLAPYAASEAQIVISQVRVTDATHGEVEWSRTRNGTALEEEEDITIPQNIAAVDTRLIVGSISYTYTPPVLFGITQPITFSDTILMSPRLSDEIELR